MVAGTPPHVLPYLQLSATLLAFPILLPFLCRKAVSLRVGHGAQESQRGASLLPSDITEVAPGAPRGSRTCPRSHTGLLAERVRSSGGSGLCSPRRGHGCTPIT